MKKIILVLSLLILAYFGQAQGIGGGYTYIAQRYNWLAGVFNNGFGLPAGESAGFFTGQNQRAGALYYDSTGLDSGLYYWSGLVWHKVGEGTGSQVYVNAPLTMDVDTIEIGEVSVINDGYLSAANFEKFDSLRNDWWRDGSRLHTMNPTDSVFIGAPPTVAHKWNLVGNGYLVGVVYGLSNRRVIHVDGGGQNAFFGSRSGNDTYSGAVENFGGGELTLGSITSGDNNTAVGKGAGFTLTTGSNNFFAGRNVHASGGAFTGTNNVAIEANVPDPTANDQFNLNDWVSGTGGRTTIGKPAVSGGDNATLFLDSITGYPNLHLQRTSDPSSLADGQIWHATDNRVKGRFNATTETFAFLSDIGPGGSQNLQDVTDIGNATTNDLIIKNTANTTLLDMFNFDNAGAITFRATDSTDYSYLRQAGPLSAPQYTFLPVGSGNDTLATLADLRAASPATPGLEDVIVADGTLTANRTINVGSNTLNIGGSATAFSLLGTGSGPVGFAQIQPASTNTILPVYTFRRSTTGTAASGIGGRFDLELLNGSGSSIVANSIKWRLTNVTASAEESEFIVNGLGAGADRNFLTVQTNGTALVNNGADTLETRSGARSRAEIVTNKRNVRRVTTITSSATPTPAGDDTDIFTVTALAAGAVFAAPTGTPIPGQGLIIRIKDNGGAQTLGWNAVYRAGDISLPTTTVAGKYLWLGFIWNDQSSTWDLLSKIDNF